jgi:hypothetical protein
MTDPVLIQRLAAAFDAAALLCDELQSAHRAASAATPLLEPYMRQLIGEAVHLHTRLHELKDLAMTHE